MDRSTVQLTIAFTAPDFSLEEREAEAQRLMHQLQHMDEVEKLGRIPEEAPEGSKAGTGFLMGLLMAEVNRENAKKLFGFLGDRLSGKTIELEVEGNSRKLKVKASSQEELQIAIAEATKFIEN